MPRAQDITVCLIGFEKHKAWPDLSDDSGFCCADSLDKHQSVRDLTAAPQAAGYQPSLWSRTYPATFTIEITTTTARRSSKWMGESSTIRRKMERYIVISFCRQGVEVWLTILFEGCFSN